MGSFWLHARALLGREVVYLFHHLSAPFLLLSYSNTVLCVSFRQYSLPSTAQTTFQHTELVRKKEKLSALQAKMTEESARRAANVRTVRRSVKMWREKNSLQSTTMAVTALEGAALITSGGGAGAGSAESETEAAAAATAVAIEKLHAILNDCQERGGEDADSYLALLLNLPRLIDSKAALLADDAAATEQKVAELQLVADRYRAETDVVAAAAAAVGGSAGASGGGACGAGGTGGQQQLMEVEHPMQEEPAEAVLM